MKETLEKSPAVMEQNNFLLSTVDSRDTLIKRPLLPQAALR